MPRGLLLISTQTALIFWCHQGWKRWLALASEVLKHPVVSGVMVVRVRVRVVVVGEDRVGIRPLWVTPCHVIGLLTKAQQTSHVSKTMRNVICDDTQMIMYSEVTLIKTTNHLLYISYGRNIKRGSKQEDTMF